MNPSLTTLCYIEKDNQYLMLHRVKLVYEGDTLVQSVLN